MMRKFAVLAVEGTHASGKTTLTHGLAAHYREQGIHVATVEEPARRSPFEEIVVHGRGQFDLETEADLFGAQLSAQLRAAPSGEGILMRGDASPLFRSPSLVSALAGVLRPPGAQMRARWARTLQANERRAPADHAGDSCAAGTAGYADAEETRRRQ